MMTTVLILMLAATLGAFFTPLSLWRNSAGQRWRLLAALASLFFAGAGVFIALSFVQQAWGFAQQGGPLWWAAGAMCCTALVGLIFIGVFGYLSLRLFNRRLWLAGVHVSLALATLGTLLSVCYRQQLPLVLPVDAATEVHEMVNDRGEILPLGFSFRADAATPERLTCHVERSYKGHTEVLTVALRPGESYSAKGWTLRMVSAQGNEAHLSATYEPAELPIVTGWLGVLLCLGGAALSRRLPQVEC